jgi:ElaB/YqjD/DUF883 family membrane-anchored ribosome-binding protein
LPTAIDGIEASIPRQPKKREIGFDLGHDAGEETMRSPRRSPPGARRFGSMSPDLWRPPGMTADPMNADDQASAALKARLADVAGIASSLLKDLAKAVRARGRAYAGPAGQSVDEAQRFLVERVKARPVTAMFAGLGAGLLLGLLLSSRGK